MPRTSRSSKRRQLDSNSEDDFIDDGPSTSKEKPKKSSKKRTTETTKNNSDSEDEQGEKRLHGFTPAEITQLSHNIAKYVLNNSISKFPIKRADVVKNVLNGNGKIFDHAFGVATESLRSVFGLITVVVDDIKSGKQFIVYSAIQSLSEQEMNESAQKEVTLLFLVLSYIYMKGGEVSEMALFNVLAKMNIDEVQDHAYFGNVAKLIRTTFPKMLYIKRTKLEIEGIDEEKIMLTWGQRAFLEVKKKQMLMSVSKIMGKSPAAFIKQYGETHGDDETGDVTMVENSGDSS